MHLITRRDVLKSLAGGLVCATGALEGEEGLPHSPPLGQVFTDDLGRLFFHGVAADNLPLGAYVARRDWYIISCVSPTWPPVFTPACGLLAAGGTYGAICRVVIKGEVVVKGVRGMVRMWCNYVDQDPPPSQHYRIHRLPSIGIAYNR